METLTTFLFHLKNGDVIEIDAEDPDTAWVDFYDEFDFDQEKANRELDYVSYH